MTSSRSNIRVSDRVTSNDVARLAGVSQSAVSRVFTPGASASRETTEKVRAAADTLGYRPNVLARAMTTGRSRIIGLVVAYIENQFYPAVIEQLSRDLQARGYHILMFMAENAADKAEDVLAELLDHQVDGIITASVGISNDLTQRCSAAGIPVVMFNRGQDDPRLSEVTSDNVNGGRRAAEFLIAGGHKRIAHIMGWQGASTGRHRAQGFRAALKRVGLTPFAMEDGGYARETAAALARDLCSRRARPDAIFVGSDQMAFAVMDELRFGLGFSIPNDISVIGYDDVPVAAWPSYDLTTVRQPVDAMVRATVEALLGQIEGDHAPKRVLIDAPLIVRSSARKPQGKIA
jgi:DNA-binding LacI/PurR family transcriptional regulator